MNSIDDFNHQVELASMLLMILFVLFFVVDVSVTRPPEVDVESLEEKNCVSRRKVA